jgi:tRNA G18 (ribose-2'-O)-methylase SpoU
MIGIGPWVGDWPTDSRYDQELLRAGDRRNVEDRYRYWSMAAIRADLAARRDPARALHVAIENWEHDFNIGSIVRTANAFNAAGIHIIGRRHWNRRGAMVTDRYLDVYQYPDVETFLDWRNSVILREDNEVNAVAESPRQRNTLPLIGIDNIPGAVAMENYRFPPSCVLVFGAEATGISEPMLAACDAIVQITQEGSTRSINAGAAAAIAMYAWRAQSGQ